MKNAILIGIGALSWMKCERVSDRYGTVAMFNENSHEEIITNGANLFVNEVKKHEGEIGQLVCKIIETRQSTHIGDFFHGFFPSTPKKGAKIKLGEGQLHYEFNQKDTVGLKPLDNRETFWLNPKQLYKVHEQTIELYFVPKTD